MGTTAIQSSGIFVLLLAGLPHARHRAPEH